MVQYLSHASRMSVSARGRWVANVWFLADKPVLTVPASTSCVRHSRRGLRPLCCTVPKRATSVGLGGWVPPVNVIRQIHGTVLYALSSLEGTIIHWILEKQYSMMRAERSLCFPHLISGRR